MGYEPFKTRCSICYAVVVVADRERHEGWHRTLSNVPDEDLPEVTFR